MMTGPMNPQTQPYRQPPKIKGFEHQPSQLSQSTMFWRPALNPMMGPMPSNEPASAISLPVNVQVQAPAQNDDLQSKHPGLKARLAKNQILADLTPDLVGLGKTLGKVASHKSVDDAKLADLDDNMKRIGSLTIATLATLGLKQRILGVGEFVGFASWFAAMAATPTVINNMVRLKTGVNLGQKYDSSYGERLNLFKDPNYLPLHILPKEKMDQLASRLKIPPGPNQRREVEEKMRQISVQTHTWWMLAAGPATPVISGLMADVLQGPITRRYNAAARYLTSVRAHQAKNSDNLKELEKRLDKHLDRLVGPLPESELTSWWKDFGESLVNHSGMRDSLSRKDVMNGNQSDLVDKIAKYLAGDAGIEHPLKHSRVQKTLEYLKKQYSVTSAEDGKTGLINYTHHGKLGQLRERAMNFLKEFETDYETRLKTAKREEKASLEKRLNIVRTKMNTVEDNILNATSTVEHYQNLFKDTLQTFESRFNPQNIADDAKPVLNALKSDIRSKLKNNTLTDLALQKVEGASLDSAKKVNSNIMKLESSLAAGRNRIANQVMGANPGSHLARVLKDVKARALWRNRVVYGFGGTLVAASAVYSLFFVGRDFKKPQATPNGGQS